MFQGIFTTFNVQPSLSGESAGAGMTMALLLHQESSSRVRGAFVQSGATLFNFMSADKARKIISEKYYFTRQKLFSLERILFAHSPQTNNQSTSTLLTITVQSFRRAMSIQQFRNDIRILEIWH